MLLHDERFWKPQYTLEKQVCCFNHGVVILVASQAEETGYERFTLVLETIVAQGNQRDSYTLIILQPLSCVLIVTTNICEGNNWLV